MAQISNSEKKMQLVKPPPFYSPLLWPFLNVWEVSRQSNEVQVKSPKSLATLGLVDHSFALVSSFRSFLLAYAIINWSYDDASPYPAWGRGMSRIYNLVFVIYSVIFILK